MLDGSEVWCMGYSEPGAGSDLAAVSTTAVREGDHYRITGRKIWTSYAHHADRCLLIVKSSRDLPRHHNISYLLPDMHQPGIQVNPIITAAGDHHFNEVVFDGAIATRDERLGPENEGWALFRGGLAMGRGATVAMTHYIEVRSIGQILLDCCAAADHPVRRSAESLMVQVDLIRWQVMRVAEMDASGLDSRAARTVLKLTWTELWQDIVEFGLKLRCPRHRDYWRYQYIRAKGHVIAGGTSDIQRSTIAGRVLLRDSN
jgi:alkylation response protein AidB-like acyl-CoA dehydrogenase